MVHYEELNMNYRIPFNKPFIIGKELYYIAQSVMSGHISGDGYYSKKCEGFLEQLTGAKRVFLTTSCTAALEMAAMICEVKEGDEVILPSFTFVSTANAFAMRGARLRFVDIRQDTLNINENLIEEAINEKTKVIIPVHYAGVACEMDKLNKIAKKYGVRIVEDAAQAVNASYKDKYLGTLGDLGAFSFHETKNYISGEGGALITDNLDFAERIEILREKGTNRKKFFQGQVDKYTWVDIGSSYVLSDILAAFLFAQLEHMNEITNRLRTIYNLYTELLYPLADQGLVRLPMIPEECGSNYHIFYILVSNTETREILINHLKRKGILAVFHFIPLHLSEMGRILGYTDGPLEITEELSGRLLRLPFYYELTEEDIVLITTEIKKCLSAIMPKRVRI